MLRTDQGTAQPAPGAVAPIRVVIVDDSATQRMLIRSTLDHTSDIMIVGEAGHPFEAREIIKQTSPDVLTLDIEMPHMDGLAFLRKIMQLRPMPVVMLSTLSGKGSAAAIEALRIGAVDCLGKTGEAGGPPPLAELPDKIRMAAKARLRLDRNAAKPKAMTGFDWNGRYLFIGASTGGVDALEQVLTGFPANCPPTLITQHMPESFLRSFASRLDGLCPPSIGLAADRVPLRQGHVLLAPGGAFHLGVTATRTPACSVFEGEKVTGHRPSVDVLFRSAAALGEQAVGAILTGMGSDGALGLKAMRDAGASTLAQDEQSSVVYGMPRAAADAGGAEQIVSLGRVTEAVLAHCAKATRR